MTIFIKGFAICAILVALGFMQGCATLNQKECQSANWEIIGLEDGASGRASSYIGEHRQACAEYGVAPDLETYLRGHQKGITQYCNYNNGYSLGERGGSYNQVCDRQHFGDFYKGYALGSEAFGYISEIRNLQNAIVGHNNRLDEISKQIKFNEDRIVDEVITRRERRELLEEVKSLNSEAFEISGDLAVLESSLNKAENRYERFKQRH